jgi:mono/diheme cytochrome c family protein
LKTHFRRLAPAPLLLGLAIGTLPAVALAQGADPASGSQIFLSAHCDICHGGMGSGGAGPALRNNRMLRVSDYVAAQILLGGGMMPPFADKLSDQQIAAVASYIRTSWGNKAGPIDAATVTGVRKLLVEKHALPDAGGGD